MEKPIRLIKAKPPISETGIVTSGMMVARKVLKNRKIKKTTSATASAMVI